MLSREELEEMYKRGLASKAQIEVPPIVELTDADRERIQAQLKKDKEQWEKERRPGDKWILKRNNEYARYYTHSKEKLKWREDKELDINEEDVIKKAFEEASERIQPLQTDIEWKFESVNAPSIIKFLNYQNEKRGYAYRLDFKMHGKQAKRLVDIYGEEAVKQALIKAAHSAKNEEGKNNFIGFKYVEGILSRQLKKSMK